MLKKEGYFGKYRRRESGKLIKKKKLKQLDMNYMMLNIAKEGKNYFLRIFIDKTGGIDLNDCEKVNNEIDEILDEADYIKEQYFLEVSSPGIERIIRKEKHLKKIYWP